MAEGFEPYHVPQQSRRDKLRILAQNHHPESTAVIPFYDPNSLVLSSSSSDFSNAVTLVKPESAMNPPYLDPHPSTLHLNPNSITQEISNYPFFYTQNNFQNIRDFDNHEIVLFKPQPLSLSLSSNSSRHHNSTDFLPMELNLQKYGPSCGGGYVLPGGSSSNDPVPRVSVPLGPFTGYASILKGSRFLKPAQQLLEEFCDVGQVMCGEKITVDSDMMESPLLNLSTSSNIVDDSGGGIRRKKSRLISMLDEVYRRYKQYYQQMQAVIASFECVAGLGNAAPFASLALKAMSKHFKCLKNVIMDQLQFTNKDQVQINPGKDEAPKYGNVDGSLYGQRPTHNSGFQPVWRPQRGLPERAVTVLRAWLFEHFLHPYPTDTDKIMLAKQTGLSRSQVSNWFINARVRLWKPMVEEIHMLETRQTQKASQREEPNPNGPNDRFLASNSVLSDNPSTSFQKVQDNPSKRTRNEFSSMPFQNEEPLNLSYNSLTSPVPVGVSMGGGSNSGVSLTLGLHQNNGSGLSEPYPINTVQRFGLGLEGNNEGYVLGGYGGSHNRHFGRDVMGGQLFHDFVG